MATLRERKVIHSSNNPVADYAEGLPVTSEPAGATSRYTVGHLVDDVDWIWDS